MADLAYWEVYRMTAPCARRNLVTTYRETGSISATARKWHTTRQTVRKWVRRFEVEGEAGLVERSHRPHHCPRQMVKDLEDQITLARKETSYGRQRLALLLRSRDVQVSPDTIGMFCGATDSYPSASDLKLSTLPSGVGNKMSPLG